MTLQGSAVSVKTVIQPEVAEHSVNISLSNAGEVRRLGRILIAFLEGTAGRGTQTDAFASDLIASLGYDENNTAKR